MADERQSLLEVDGLPQNIVAAADEPGTREVIELYELAVGHYIGAGPTDVLITRADASDSSAWLR